MAWQGMDPAAVRAVADRLDREATAVGDVLGQIDSVVSSLPGLWDGSDARSFVDWWNQQHRPALVQVQESIAGLATSARNNATDQEHTSGVGFGAGPGNLSPLVLAGLLGGGLAGFFRGDGGGWSAQGTASAFAGLGAEGTATAGFGPDGLSAGVAGSVYAGIGAAAAGSVTYGIMSAQGEASAFVGARADGSADARFGPDGASVSAEASAFVGAEANASGSVDVGGLGASGTASAYAGLGVTAEASASITSDSIKVQAELGAALGLGFGFDVSFEVKPAEIASNIAEGVSNFFGW